MKTLTSATRNTFFSTAGKQKTKSGRRFGFSVFASGNARTEWGGHVCGRCSVEEEGLTSNYGFPLTTFLDELFRRYPQSVANEEFLESGLIVYLRCQVQLGQTLQCILVLWAKSCGSQTAPPYLGAILFHQSSNGYRSYCFSERASQSEMFTEWVILLT
jgi:hypothetical protein